MDSFLLVAFLDACLGWLGALVLLVVGAIVVMKADQGAGLVLAGAGVVKLLLNCCLIAPNAALQLGAFDVDPAVFTTNMILVQLQRLAFFGLLAFAVIRLTNVPGSKEAQP